MSCSMCGSHSHESTWFGCPGRAYGQTPQADTRDIGEECSREPCREQTPYQLRQSWEIAIENEAGAKALLAQWKEHYREERLAMQKEYIALKEHCRVLSNASLNMRHARIERLEGMNSSLLEQRTRLQDKIADLRCKHAAELNVWWPDSKQAELMHRRGQVDALKAQLETLTEKGKNLCHALGVAYSQLENARVLAEVRKDMLGASRRLLLAWMHKPANGTTRPG